MLFRKYIIFIATRFMYPHISFQENYEYSEQNDLNIEATDAEPEVIEEEIPLAFFANKPEGTNVPARLNEDNIAYEMLIDGMKCEVVSFVSKKSLLSIQMTLSV